MNRKLVMVYIHIFHETAASLEENFRFLSIFPLVEEIDKVIEVSTKQVRRQSVSIEIIEVKPIYAFAKHLMS